MTKVSAMLHFFLNVTNGVLHISIVCLTVDGSDQHSIDWFQ